MRRAVLDQLRRSGGNCSLLRLASGHPDRAILAAFGGRQPQPLWVAKIASSAAASDRLRKEHENLQVLGSCARELRIPEILAWEDNGDAVCLIETGLPGLMRRCVLPLDADARTVASLFEPIADWLEKFAAIAPLPPQMALSAIATCRSTALLAARTDLGPALTALLDVLKEGGTATSLRPVPVHGDLFPSNLLWSDAGLGICDWEAFAAGAPFEDLFSGVVYWDYTESGKVCSYPERYRHVFFSDSNAARWLRRQVLSRGYQENDIRFCFYAFLVRQFYPDRALASSVCRELLEWLSSRGFPPPWPDHLAARAEARYRVSAAGRPAPAVQSGSPRTEREP